MIVYVVVLTTGSLADLWQLELAAQSSYGRTKVQRITTWALPPLSPFYTTPLLQKTLDQPYVDRDY